VFSLCHRVILSEAKNPAGKSDICGSMSYLSYIRDPSLPLVAQDDILSVILRAKPEGSRGKSDTFLAVCAIFLQTGSFASAQDDNIFSPDGILR